MRGDVWSVTDKNDPVNHPSHYTQGGIEALDAIASALSASEFVGYLKGQIFKYMWRAPHKNKALEDYKKARFYLDMLISREESNQESQRTEDSSRSQ